jgi:hypothetical protein
MHLIDTPTPSVAYSLNYRRYLLSKNMIITEVRAMVIYLLNVCRVRQQWIVFCSAIICMELNGTGQKKFTAFCGIEMLISALPNIVTLPYAEPV